MAHRATRTARPDASATGPRQVRSTTTGPINERYPARLAPARTRSAGRSSSRHRWPGVRGPQATACPRTLCCARRSGTPPSGCVKPSRGPIRFSAATPCSCLDGCYPRPVNAYAPGNRVARPRAILRGVKDRQGCGKDIANSLDRVGAVRAVSADFSPSRTHCSSAKQRPCRPEVEEGRRRHSAIFLLRQRNSGRHSAFLAVCEADPCVVRFRTCAAEDGQVAENASTGSRPVR
jgi:hypothetical protein